MQISSLIESSKTIFLDSSLPNGAIIAAPSHKEYYPKEAKNYFYVWPRDGAFICIAAKLINLTEIIEPFFHWCIKAQGWQETGLFYKKYTIDGKKARTEFQPDQNGTVLIALHDYCQNNKELIAKFHHLLSHSADGLCQVWDKDHFSIPTQDVWEERSTSPDLKDNFTYSLAICIRGLRCAHQLIPNQKWQNTTKEMETVLLSTTDHFSRTNLDQKTDASLLGLVWPSGIISAKDPRIVTTINLIEQTFGKDFKIHRYDNDHYDGWIKDGIAQNKGSGYWPLLNFWMSLYYLEYGNKEKALKYYYQVLQDLKQKQFIPEQIFDNNIQVSVSPLCWSHAMFVIVSKKLERIKQTETENISLS